MIRTPKNKTASNGEDKCRICNSDKNKKNQKWIDCSKCNCLYHAGCIHMEDEQYEMIKSDVKTWWLCEDCEQPVKNREKNHDGSGKLISQQISDGNKTIIDMIAKQNDILNGINTEIALVKKNAKIDVVNLEEKFDDKMNMFEEKLNAVNGPSNELQISEFSKRVNEIDGDVGFLYDKALVSEKITRNHAIVVTGIFDKSNSTEFFIKSIIRIGEVLKVTVHESDIDDIYPIFAKDKLPRFIVKFTRILKKQEMIKGIREKRSLYLREVYNCEGADNKQIFLNEHLNWLNHNLWKEAKTLKQMNFVKYAWIRDGDVLVKKNEGDKYIIIKSMSDIRKMKGE